MSKTLHLLPIGCIRKDVQLDTTIKTLSHLEVKTTEILKKKNKWPPKLGSIDK